MRLQSFEIAAWVMLIACVSLSAKAADSVVAGRVDADRIVGAALTAKPESGSDRDNWLAHGRTYAEDRHSPLTEINPGNVAELGLAWSYDTRSHRGLESTPIVVDGVMYATSTWSVVFALDAKTGRELWRFDPKVPGQKGRDACCDVVNRGVAVWKGRVYVGTLDGRLIALDAATGTPIWDVLTIKKDSQHTITGAPRVVKDLVIIGNGGADLGARGYFGAYDAATGELRWRFYTVPASKHGPHEHKELVAAAATWSEDSLWESGLGGTAWDSMAYDPALDLLYVGTGNSSVYDVDIRSPGGGDNLYLASILALRPETGELVWHYQTTPEERWDYTATQHMILADIEWQGVPRKVLLQAPKNGFFYVLDRATGELLSAEPYVPVSWATHVNLKTGRPVQREEANWSKEAKIVTPAVMGAHSWHPMSFDPARSLVYMSTFELSHMFLPNPSFKFKKGGYNTGEDWGELAALSEGITPLADSYCSPSRLVAWDPIAQEKRWEVKRDHISAAGVLSTASGLVFQGESNGVFGAYDSDTGARLWQLDTGLGIMAAPVTYRVDGEQYVAVLAGFGGSLGLNFVKTNSGNAGRVFAFKVGGTAALPASSIKSEGSVVVEKIDASPEAVVRGRELYGENCLRCHGADAVSLGILPDLRFASREVHADWIGIVLGGTRATKGMASFADLLTVKEAEAIQAYVVSNALREPTAFDTMVRWLAESPFCLRASWTAD